MDEKITKYICLDLDGVFFNKTHSNIIELLSQKFSLTPGLVQEVLFKRASIEGGYNDLKLGKIESDIYWNWLFGALGIKYKYSKAEYLNDLHSLYNVNDDAINLINNLHQQGVKTAVCSNNYKDNIDGLKLKFNLDKYFDVQVYSYEVGVMKPDSTIYAQLVTRAGVSPESIVLFDDKVENLSGARSLGIECFEYIDFEGLLNDIKNCGIKLN